MFDTDDDPFLSPRELCERYNDLVALETLELWRREGCGPDYYKIGSKVLYRLSDVREWELLQRRHQPQSWRRSNSVRKALADLDAIDGRAG